MMITVEARTLCTHTSNIISFAAIAYGHTYDIGSYHVSLLYLLCHVTIHPCSPPALRPRPSCAAPPLPPQPARHTPGAATGTHARARGTHTRICTCIFRQRVRIFSTQVNGIAARVRAQHTIHCKNYDKNGNETTR